jgi:hypothetical protein
MFGDRPILHRERWRLVPATILGSRSAKANP